MPTRCEVGHLFERSAQQPTFWHWLGKGSFSIKEKGSKYHVEDGLGKAGQLPAASRAVEDVTSLMPSSVLPHYSQVEVRHSGCFLCSYLFAVDGKDTSRLLWSP